MSAGRDVDARVLAGRYQLGGQLGRGGMAEVREATDRRLGRVVAVKLLRIDLAQQPVARRRFEAEARAAGRLTHPNVVTVYDTGEDDGQPFLVMERLPGRTLAHEIHDGPLGVERALDVARGVLAALSAAHRVGIVHRDVKPGNVLLTADAHPKVADFGIAKTAEVSTATMTMTGELLATPAYVAPERLAGERATPASDLYSVGVLLYESLAGRQPFGTGPPAARFDAIARGRIEPIQSIRGDLPDGLVGVIERAMSRRPSDRFESADAMAAALERSLERADTTAPASTATVAVDVPPLAKTRALPPRAGGHSRKRRGMLAAFVALVLLAALAVGLLVTRNDDGSAPASPSAVSTPPTTGGPAPTSPSPLPAPLDRAIRQLERAVTP